MDTEYDGPKREKYEDDIGLDIQDSDEPNEYLHIPAQPDTAWLVRVPKSLMETWNKVPKDQAVHLGTVRVYNKNPNDPTGQQKISILLPERPKYDIGDETREFELEMQEHHVNGQPTSQQVKGHYVLADKPKDNTPKQRARSNLITGKVLHKASMKPKMSEAYVAKLRKRVEEANKPKKSIQYIDDKGEKKLGGGVNLKMIQSGAKQTSAGFEVKKGKGPGKEFERAARISRDELLDQLFSLFTVARPFWNMKDLRQRTVQPEAYLKEVLGDIGIFHRTGPNHNTFSLKPEYAPKPKEDSFAGPSGLAGTGSIASGSAGVKEEQKMEDDDDEESDSDDDMEEVS